MGYSQCFRWYGRFKSGRRSLENYQWSERPTSCVTPWNVLLCIEFRPPRDGPSIKSSPTTFWGVYERTNCRTPRNGLFAMTMLSVAELSSLVSFPSKITHYHFCTRPIRQVYHLQNYISFPRWKFSSKVAGLTLLSKSRVNRGTSSTEMLEPVYRCIR